MTETNRNNLGIISVEAKDLYIQNKYFDGYIPRYTKGKNKGEYVMSKFKASSDYSLETTKLRKVYNNVYHNSKFSFFYNNREFTNRLVTVTYTLSVKNWNKLNSNTYEKIGYKTNEQDIHDCVGFNKNGEIVYIVCNKQVNIPVDTQLLGEHFYYDENSKMYVCKNNFNTIMSANELREWTYVNGFMCDGIKFVRFKRSGGSARVGKCLFIDENLYSLMHKWELCGLNIEEGDDIDLASFEAYISLTTSSIIDTIEIKPENILVIDDYESVFNHDVIGVRLENGKLVSKEEKTDISNSIWDGQSLIDVSLLGKYKNKGMVLLRNRFFKSCCFNCNIQQWFKDNNITQISQLNGKTQATCIEDVKLITTPSSIKYLKFDVLNKWLRRLDTTFGLVKYEKKTHHLDGKCVFTHYQLLNTLQMTQQEVEDFVKSNFDYLDMVRDDPCVLRSHIKYVEDVDCFRNELPLKNKNDIIYKMLGVNNMFYKTKLYDNFLKSLRTSMIKDMRKGHIYVNGNYSTLCGNPIEMLQHSIGIFKGKSVLGIGNISTSNFDYGQTILGSRSPHVSMNNIWLAKNIKNDYIDRYMNRTSEIVYINSIDENVLRRLSGADFDSDTVMLTDNKYLIKAAMRNYNTFLTAVNHVPSKKTNRKYTNKDKCMLDIKTSKNKIGEIVNLSQELNSIIWDKLNNGDKDIEEIYHDVCKLNILSEIEIDSAKRETDVDTVKELKELRIKYHFEDEDGRRIKPYFFEAISKMKGYCDKNRNNYSFHNTTMDYLEKSINKYCRKKKKREYELNFVPLFIQDNKKVKQKEFIKFADVLVKHDYENNPNRYMVAEVLREIRKYKNKKSNIIKQANDTFKILNIHNELILLEEQLVEFLNTKEFTKDTMIYMLRQFDNEKYKDIYNTLFYILFGYSNSVFYSCIVDSTEKLDKLEESPCGNINILDYKFNKVKL